MSEAHPAEDLPRAHPAEDLPRAPTAEDLPRAHPAEAVDVARGILDRAESLAVARGILDRAEAARDTARGYPMRELSIWLDAHCSRGDMGVFRSSAELADAGTTDIVHSVGSGTELMQLIYGLESEGVTDIDHLVIAGHGGTTWLLDDEHGVTTRAPRHGDQIHVYELGGALVPILSPSPLISLAACLCSRSPTWLLRRRWGQRLTSDWGPRAYLPGGEASFSARLRDVLSHHGLDPRVRGHRAAGHATALALLAEHRWPAASACDTLYRRVHPELEPSWPVRRRWVRLVTGRLAQRWLMGDDSVVEEIRRAW